MLILSILKTIVFVLLILLAVLLLLLAAVLLIPVRYRIRGSFIDEIPAGHAKVSWFLSLISVKAEAGRDIPLSAGIYLFGIRIIRLLGNDKSSQAGADKETSEERATGILVNDNAGKGGMDKNVGHSDAAEKITLPVSAVGDKQGTDSTSFEDRQGAKTVNKALESGENARSGVHEKAYRAAKGRKPEKSKTKVSLSEKFGSLKAKLISSVRKIYAIIKGNSRKASMLYNLLHEERYQPSVALLKRSLMRILSEAKPREGGGYVLFGLGDPFSTGQAMQAAALFYPLYGGIIDIIPEFEKSALKADINARGRIRLIVPAAAGIRIFFNKGLRSMFNKAKLIIGADINDDGTLKKKSA